MTFLPKGVIGGKLRYVFFAAPGGGVVDTRYVQGNVSSGGMGGDGVKKDDPELIVDPELRPEPYGDPYGSLEEANEEYMNQSEELYLALEESRWCPHLITTSLCENDL